MEDNINQSAIVQEIPNFDNTPLAGTVSPEISNLGRNIQSRAKTGLLEGNKQLYGLDLNEVTKVGTSNKIKLNKFDIGRDAYAELSDGNLVSRFDQYMPGVNNEELLANTQSKGEKWGNGALKFLGKTLVNVAGGTVGTVEGLINGVKMQSLSSIYDSDFNNYLEDLNKKLDYKLPNYYTEQEKDMNFGQKLSTSNFWANDFLGGMSFLAGTVISEGIWAAATGGTSLIAKGVAGISTRLLAKNLAGGSAKALAKTTGFLKPLIRAGAKSNVDNLVKAGIKADKLSEGLNTARFLYTSAGFEAGVEARHYMMDATEEFKTQFEMQNGRTPDARELAEFNSTLTDTANGLFAANVGLVGTSNLTVLGKLFLNKAPSKTISNSLFKKVFLGVGYKKAKDGGIKTIAANAYQKSFSKVYSVAKPAITEGFIEEGGQAVLSTAATDYVLSAYDSDNVNDGLSLIESLQSGFEYAYGTKQGLTEVGLGALIGILGGAVATKGRFNEVSSERTQLEESAKYINSFTRDNLVENLKFGAKMRKSTIESEKARSEGNMTNEMRADMAAMTAVAERAYHYENKEDTLKDFYTAIDNMDSESLKEDYGLSDQEISIWKGDKKSQFKEVMDMHTRNLQYAEALVGGTPIAGLENISELDASGRADLKGAIAFTLTMGSKSDEFTESLANQIKLTLAKDLAMDQDVDAISVNEVLRKVNKEKAFEYNVKALKEKALREKLNRITKAKVDADNLVQLADKENNKSARAKVIKVQNELLAVQEALANIQVEKTLAYEALNITQLSDEVITEDMLDNQAENVSKLANTIETVIKKDPQRGELLKSLYSEYARAISNTKRYNELVDGMLDPKTRVNTLSGWLGKIINKKKSVNGDTAQLFINMINTYQEKNQGRNEVLKVSKAEETSEPKSSNPLDLEGESIGENDITEFSTEGLKNPIEVIEMLKNKVKDMVKRDPYTNLEYQGKEFNYEDVAPKQEELDRYNELLGKVTPGRSISNLLENPFNIKNPGGLSKSETEELQNLNTKLNNWKIITGITNENNNSVADFLKLINQLETDYQPNPTKIKIDPQELPTSEKSNAGISRDVLQTIITPDVALAKKVAKGKNYEISHVEPTSLLNLFPGSKLFALINGKNIDVSTIPADKLQELQKESGSEFILSKGEANVKVTLNDRQRLVIDIEALEALIPDSNIRILDFGNSKFMPLFIKKGDTYVPLEGDFKFKSVNENEFISLDTQRLYELSPGTILKTVVNLNDTFNDKLFKDYQDGKITKDYLINNIHIYVSPQGSVNSIVGSLRAIKDSSNPDTATFSKLHLIRKQAVRRALGSNTKRVEVGITIPLKMTLVGSPNMSVKEEEGKLIPTNNKLTQEALGMVDDYGYIVNGKLSTNKNLEYSPKDVIFASTLSKREVNRDKKIPVIVFKYKTRTVVFPVSLLEKGGSKSTKAYNILSNSNDSSISKVIKLNEFLIESNINPKKYAIYDLSSEASISEVNRLLGDLSSIPDVADIESWLDKDHEKLDLINSIGVGIDITNKPFNAPKGILDFEGIDIPNEDSFEIEAVNILDNLAKKVDSIFDKNNPFAEMVDNWAFYDEFEDRGIAKDAENYIMKKRNATILRNAFAQTIPKTVRAVLGDGLINQIKSELKEYKLMNEGLKVNTKIIDTKLNKEVSDLANKCK